jgi:hypothetical protein
MKTDQTKVFFNYQEPNVIKAIAKNVETNAVIASREVKLRHGDKPDKRIGRTYAFKKLMNHALENNLIPKQEINVLWKQFGSTCKQPNQKLAY